MAPVVKPAPDRGAGQLGNVAGLVAGTGRPDQHRPGSHAGDPNPPAGGADRTRRIARQRSRNTGNGHADPLGPAGRNRPAFQDSAV